MTTRTDKLTASHFGPDFTWGVATASYQIEGATQADGRGVSIWDSFSATPGTVLNGDTGEEACDFYHRYDEDIALIQRLNLNAFRFSLAWPRIIPQGTGKANAAGLDFYNRVVDSCLERGIAPWVTLYHWDLPQRLQDRGGWSNRDVYKWYLDYVRVCAEALGDRVKHWMVFNEPSIFTGYGYLRGNHAPGVRNLDSFFAATHHVNLCQGAGIKLLKDILPKAKIGTSHSLNVFRAATESDEDRRAARILDTVFNRLQFDPLVGEPYPLDVDPRFHRLERYLQSGDLDICRARPDFLGVQYYSNFGGTHDPASPVFSARNSGAKERNMEANSFDWAIYPDGMTEVLARFGRPEYFDEVIITENGMPLDDVVVDEKVRDPRRIDYFKRHLTAALKAREAGVPLTGYFAWSLLDNYEWAAGYSQRFGIVHVDYATQRRTVKDSGYWFQRFLADKK